MENDLNRVVDLLPGLVWTALPDGQVDFVNQRWCEYTGLSVAEAYGEGWQTAIHLDDLPELLNRWRSILASNASGEMEARLRRSDGEYRWFLFRTRPLADAYGRVAKWCGLNIDVEEVRQARARSELAHVNRVTGLSVLTASIAHEVNQPLAAIITNGETSLRWLTRDDPDIEKVKTFTERVVAEARRASEIIERIRGMASQRAPEHKLLSIDDVINESLSFLRHELQHKGIVVTLDLAPGLPQIVGDRTQLQQVIVNLTMNAVQAMTQLAPEGRKISLRTTLADPERVHCSIEDSGPGVDSEHLPRLFDSFFTTKDIGMGVGLAICQAIIEAHGGSIRADNNSSLGGARFSFGLLTADAQ